MEKILTEQIRKSIDNQVNDVNITKIMFGLDITRSWLLDEYSRKEYRAEKEYSLKLDDNS